MALIGTAIGGALGAYGSKPKVPPFKKIDLAEEQMGAINQNIAALPKSQALASSVNQFNQAELEKMLESALPGYSNIKNRVSQNIQSELAGEIPLDVSQAVQRNSAVRSLYGGYSGSGMARNLTARDLGLNSLQLTQQGLDSASRWISMSRAPQFDVTSMFVSPQQRASFNVSERDSAFNAQWLRNQVKAAPDPFMAALGQAFIQDESSIMQMAGSAAGAAGGGGGGM